MELKSLTVCWLLFGVLALEGSTLNLIGGPTDSSGASPPPLARRALVIGMFSYETESRPKEQVLNDVHDMESMLEDLGFQVDSIENAPLARLEIGISNFANSIKEGDVVLVYYAGHGIQLEGDSQLIALDYSEADRRTYAVAKLLRSLQRNKPRLTIAIFDACRNSLSGIGTGLRIDPDTFNTYVASATTLNDSIKDDATGRNGNFTGALLETLKVPGLNLDEVFERVTAIVNDKTNGEQRPSVSKTVATPFVLRDTEQARFWLAKLAAEKARHESEISRQLPQQNPISTDERRRIRELIESEIRESRRRQDEIQKNEEIRNHEREEEQSEEYKALDRAKSELRRQIASLTVSGDSNNALQALSLEDARKRVANAISAIAKTRDAMLALRDQEMLVIDNSYKKLLESREVELRKDQFETSSDFAKRKERERQADAFLKRRWAAAKAEAFAHYSAQMAAKLKPYDEELRILKSRSYPAETLAAVWHRYDADSSALTVEAAAVLYRFSVPTDIAKELYAIKGSLRIESEYEYYEEGSKPVRRNVTLVEPRGGRFSEALITGPTNVSATGAKKIFGDQEYWYANRFDEYEETASQELASGATLSFTLQHPHPLHNVHPIEIQLSNRQIAFHVVVNGLGSRYTDSADSPPTGCHLEGFSTSLANLVSSEVITNKQQELLLVLKLKHDGSSGSVDTFEFADQYASKAKWVSKGALGIGVVRRSIRSRPEAKRALDAVKNTIDRAAAQARMETSTAK